jgi:UDP-glucose 4-epimerase
MERQIQQNRTRVLVTGGAGFIGIPLTRSLLERGCEVAILDCFRYPARRRFVPEHPILTVYEGDLRNDTWTRQVVEDFKPSVVYHLAAIHYIPECEANPIEALEINVVSTQIILDAVRSLPLRRFHFSSTSAVYLYQGAPYGEDDPLGPMDLYGITKYTCEMLVRHFHKTTGHSCVITRFFNVYGENETQPHVIPAVLEQLKNGNRIVKLGNLESRRDFVFLEDLVNALIALMNVEGIEMDAFNIGTGSAVSIRELVQTIEDLIKEPIHVEVDPARLRKTDAPLLQMKVGKLAKAAGWRSQYDLRRGLEITLRSEGLVK